MFAEDLSAFFKLQNRSAVWTPSSGGASQTAQVLLDAPDVEFLDGAVQSREYEITYAATGLQGLKTAETLTVDGVSFTVREVTALDDGRLMRATLTKP
ncbi:MAG: head-tail joining protein [Gammaproteobacteria bacterium]